MLGPNPEVDVGASLGTVDFGGGAPTRVITASADGAARAWSVGADARAPTREQLGSDDAVAQHACECYGAAWHPQRPELAVTVARDGGVRLWSMPSASGSRGVPGQGSVVTGIAPGEPGVAATALAFDKGGHRVFVGADGRVEGDAGGARTGRARRRFPDERRGARAPHELGATASRVPRHHRRGGDVHPRHPQRQARAGSHDRGQNRLRGGFLLRRDAQFGSRQARV